MTKFTPLEYPVTITGHGAVGTIFWWFVSAVINLAIWFGVIRLLTMAVVKGLRP